MEVLITCDESENKNSINFWNPISGTKLSTLRAPPVHPASLSLIRNEGFLISETGKPFIHIWQAGHPLQTSRRILCSGKPGPMAMSPDGAFLIVAIEEKINIWQVSTGRIVTVLSSHYRPVTVLKFNDDGSYFLSAGQDGMVLAFKFISVVSKASRTPTYSWSDHSFPVTDVHIGIGGSKATVFSVSSDRTAKVYSLLNGGLILSVAFPVPLTTIVADPAEFAFYVGGSNGSIYQMKLHSPPRSIEHHVSSDAAADYVFKIHTEAITGLCISADGKTLGSADGAGVIHLWDVGSRQPMKTIIGNKVKVTNLRFWLGDPENLKGTQKPSIVFPDVPKLVEAVDKDEFNEVVTVWNRVDLVEESDSNYVSSSSTNSTENSAEVSNLKAQLAKSEEINRKLHQFCVENILGQG